MLKLYYRLWTKRVQYDLWWTYHSNSATLMLPHHWKGFRVYIIVTNDNDNNGHLKCTVHGILILQPHIMGLLHLCCSTWGKWWTSLEWEGYQWECTPLHTLAVIQQHPKVTITFNGNSKRIPLYRHIVLVRAIGHKMWWRESVFAEWADRKSVV